MQQNTVVSKHVLYVPSSPLLCAYPLMVCVAKKPFVQEEVIAQFRWLIASMPWVNQYLLLHVLKLLTAFTKKAENNRMNTSSEWSSLYPFLKRGLTILPLNVSSLDGRV